MHHYLTHISKRLTLFDSFLSDSVHVPMHRFRTTPFRFNTLYSSIASRASLQTVYSTIIPRPSSHTQCNQPKSSSTQESHTLACSSAREEPHSVTTSYLGPTFEYLMNPFATVWLTFPVSHSRESRSFLHLPPTLLLLYGLNVTQSTPRRLCIDVIIQFCASLLPVGRIPLLRQPSEVRKVAPRQTRSASINTRVGSIITQKRL